MKLLVVDDEEYTREGLVEEIARKKYGFSEIMQAQDGKMALKIAKWFRPDVVLTDIRMPRMDGIAFAGDLKKILNDCQLIFMSGYMEMEYLKSAIDLHAISFVEKPIDEKKLDDALSQAIFRIRENHQKKMLTEEKGVWQKQKLLKMLSIKNSDRNEAEELCAELGWKKQYCYYGAMLLEKEVVNTPDEVCAMVEQFFESRGYSAICDYDGEYTYMMLLAYMPDKEANLTGDMKGFLVKYPSFALGVGNPVSNIRQVYSSLEAAKFVLNKFFYHPERQYFELDDTALQHELLDPRIYVDFMENYKEKPKELRQWLETLYSKIERQQSYQKEQIQQLFSSCANVPLRDYPELYQYVSGCYSQKDIETLFHTTLSLEEAKEILNKVIDGYLAMREEKHQYSHVTSTILDYVASHYKEADFMVQTLADELHFSPSYLNVVFKREMKVSLKQYIGEFRISQAKRLLENEFYKIADIGSMCGYSSANYFTKAFREETGMTPLEYREMMRKNKG